MDKLAAMQAFVEIVERGSITAAARTLRRSQPAVVRTLAALERSLGASLLRRTTRRMSLTEEGRIYLERCRRLLADLAEADALVGRSPGPPRGELRVTAPVTFGRMHVTPVVLGFLRHHEQVRVELLLLDRLVDLVEERVDLAVRIGTLADSSMIAVPVGSMRRVVCASPGLLRARGTPRHPRELERRPCVRFRGLADEVWRFREGGRDLSVRVGGSFSTNEAASALEACEAGAGFGVFLHYQVAPALRARTLRVVLAEHEPPPAPVSLVYPDARLVTPRLRALLDWLKARLPRRLGPGPSRRRTGAPAQASPAAGPLS